MKHNETKRGARCHVLAQIKAGDEANIANIGKDRRHVPIALHDTIRSGQNGPRGTGAEHPAAAVKRTHWSREARGVPGIS
jgi:hypothetical protein